MMHQSQPIAVDYILLQRIRFYNIVDLVNELEREKQAGKSGRIIRQMLRHDCLIFDELGYLPFSGSASI